MIVHQKAKLQQVKEGKAVLIVSRAQIVSRQMPVFYNPVMKFNRDVAVTLLNVLGKKGLRVCDLLTGSGVRSIRFAKELTKGIIKELFVNDASKKAFTLLQKNLKANKVKAKVSCKEASQFLLEESGMDYIDIDPFGSPNPFLDASIKRLSRNGILAVTATDVSALAGSYPKSCIRKYWALPMRNELMHEIGIRILIRKVQLIGAQYEKALMPIFSHSTAHYMRVYFSCEKSKSAVDKLLRQHGYVLYCNKCLSRKAGQEKSSKCCNKSMQPAGALWLGQLWDKALTKKMAKINPELELFAKEAAIPVFGFLDLHKFCKKLKRHVPKQEAMLKAIRNQGHKAVLTHFSPYGIRTTMPAGNFFKLLKKL